MKQQSTESRPRSGGRRRRQSPSHAASIHDVARQAGVSIKTVSRVLNKEPKVAAATRARVLSAVATLSYRPNPFARALASDRSTLVGLLFDNPGSSSSYVAGIQYGALAQCRAEGYHLIVEVLDSQASDLEDQVAALVRDSNLAGVVLTPLLCDSKAVIAALTRAGTPFVRVAPDRQLPGVRQVSIDDTQAAYDATQHLLELGHRRIGFIRGHPGFGVAWRRFEGYRAALEQAGVDFDQGLCAQGYFTYQSGMEAAVQLLSLPQPPTAIFASNDDMAAGVLAAAHGFNLKTPQELSVVGFDDSVVAQLVWPGLTTCRQPLADMAAAAVSMLVNKDEAGPSETQLQHTLIIRESTAPPKHG